MFNGLECKEIDNLIEEYYNLGLKYSRGGRDAKEWMFSLKDYVIFRTGIGLEKEMKLYKVKQRFDNINEDFK